VVLDRVLNIPYIKSIVVGNYEPMTELTQGLIDRGYRKFAFIGGIDTDDTRERYRAFSEALEKNGVSFPRQNYFSGDFREKSGYQAARIMTLSAELPEILVCANDNMAIGAIRAFTEYGLRVPEDIAVTGFDDSELAEAMGLTTISIPNYERGYLAARSLIENIHGQQNYEPMKVAATVKWRVTTKDSRYV
jgi:LacI family transcriptional regulator